MSSLLKEAIVDAAALREAALGLQPAGVDDALDYSHSMVPGGLVVTS